jgi:integrase
MPRVRLTPAFIAKAPLPPVGRREIVYWDTKLKNFGLAVTDKGHKNLVTGYRVAGRKGRMHLKSGIALTPALREHKILLGMVAQGRDPLQERRKAKRASSETFKAITEEYYTKEGDRLRSIDDRKAVLNRLVLPKLGNHQIEDISRTDIVRLLDRIASENGAPMADHVLAFVRRVMSWHASRSDTYRSPIVRGMARTSPTQRRRQRILSDRELRALWKTAEALQSAFGFLVLFILLTATRRTEAARMRCGEVSGEEWVIPEDRYKTGLKLLIPLSPAALAVLDKLPKIGKSGLVFTTDGEHPISGFSKFKRAFDVKMLAELRKDDPDATMPNWCLHDLRRSARSLMSRCGVPSDHAERCLGHVIGGVRGVYDMYEYFAEKKRAFEALAALIQRIVSPSAENVASLDERRAQGISPIQADATRAVL